MYHYPFFSEVTRIITSLFLVLMLQVLLDHPVALSDDLFIFPGQGQNNEQMEHDKYQCYSWAKQQTGFDPMETLRPTDLPPAEEVPKGGVVKGAARGALLGVVVGAIADDAGKGAAIGSATGALFGGMRRKDQIHRQQTAQTQWEQQETLMYQQKRGSYNRAYSACLEAKGYTVK